MNIHIIGAGSLGLLYAGRLAEAGARVTLWCRGTDQVECIRHKGIMIYNASGILETVIPPEVFEVYPISDYHDLSGPQGSDYTFLMVKQGKVAEAAEELFMPYQGTGHRLVCFQNGTGHMEELQKLLTHWHLYAAVTTEGAARGSYYDVVHAGSGDTHLGRFSSPGISSLSDETDQEQSLDHDLIKLLERAGFRSFLSKTLEHLIYRKLLINAVINPLTALWRIRNGELLESGPRLQLMKQLYNEGTAVYEACAIPFERDLWKQILDVCRATSANTSSMLKDVLNGSATEISSINGSIVRMGERAGVQTPSHYLIWKLVEGIQH
ncbi:ketopantoate reductase family protein [Paenibacillus lemnae]|uniref:2-dehydropantoate 2-reductase n=1 Tax=Paenibacillus lemnae TaxID=1330551 RepID=A0A848M231_PAELE|nr:ketopantoate reductase family protein [Paenibacillus lemnae]NMO94795.1 ketopantoate reductase family protein [Paenibacillus lemnae]